MNYNPNVFLKNPSERYNMNSVYIERPFYSEGDLIEWVDYSNFPDYNITIDTKSFIPGQVLNIFIPNNRGVKTLNLNYDDTINLYYSRCIYTERNSATSKHLKFVPLFDNTYVFPFPGHHRSIIYEHPKLIKSPNFQIYNLDFYSRTHFMYLESEPYDPAGLPVLPIFSSSEMKNYVEACNSIAPNSSKLDIFDNGKKISMVSLTEVPFSIYSSKLDSTLFNVILNFYETHSSILPENNVRNVTNTIDPTGRWNLYLE